jgi:fluoride exporter
MPLFLVMLGGALGAGARHLVGAGVLAWRGPGFPLATLLVNVAGGLAMGLLAGVLTRVGGGEAWRLFLGVGVLGGFTTFSAFSLDAVLLAEQGRLLAATGYVAASVIGALAALVAGLYVARAA